MGLAASQARLLTITSRKSDCEYQSMALSHQKIALARDMNVVSAEYQDALTKTKLIYDFYGNGDKSTHLTYGMLMRPSELNKYMPSPITDQKGRIVLDPALAAAAKAAGIPQEGLGCTPSSDVRDLFINSLAANGVITKSIATGVTGVQYNPNMGLGNTDIITTSTEVLNFEDFAKTYLQDVEVDLSSLTINAGGSHYHLRNTNNQTEFYINDEGEPVYKEGNDTRDASYVATYQQTHTADLAFATPNLSIYDILMGSYAIYGTSWEKSAIFSDEKLGGKSLSCIVDKVGSSSYWDILFGTLESVIDKNDAYTVAALEYAKQQTLEKVVSLGTVNTFDVSNAAHVVPANKKSRESVETTARNYSADYVGYVYVNNTSSDKKYSDGYALNLSNMTRAFYTYFAQYMQGLATSDLGVEHSKTTSNFVSNYPNNKDFSFNVVTGVDTTGNNMLISSFYDALFNQIAVKGWVENLNVDDEEYMQTMLKNGSMFISSIADDKYYYMANYATNTYIKEITDEEGIAVAEEKYNREKHKIQSKENILDMKLKNLDTEISALNTEYETVKSVITNNVKTGFSRYDA